MAAKLNKHGLTIDNIKGIIEVHQKRQVIVIREGCQQERSGVDDVFTAPLNAYTQLEWCRDRDGCLVGFGGETFGH